mgnify:FL=1
MSEQEEILTLLKDKEICKRELSDLVFGTIELRERENKKYIYVHFREDGLSLTKYVGEYTDELYNLILNNNKTARELKHRLRQVEKQLKKLNYIEKDLSEKVAMNIDFARRHMVDTVYNQAVLEGVATTYLDTETIIEGGKVSNMTPNDILKVVNLKHAWEFILNKNVIQSPTNFSLLCDINKLLEEGFYYNAGQIRSVPVSIGGTTWKPELPIESVVKEELEKILSANLELIDKAIELLLYVTKKQIFIDGNKRTSVIFANHFIISHGLGLLVIPENRVEEYKKLLIAYYEGEDTEEIKRFLKEKCYLKI